MDDVARMFAVAALVTANAFFVIGEYAVVTARRSVLGPQAEAGSRGARAALRLMNEPVRVISTVQVGITAVGILTGAIGEPLVRDLLGGGIPDWAGFLIAFAIVTYVTVIFGELVPKALTLEHSNRLAALIAPPIELIGRVLRPAVVLLERSATLLVRPFGVTEVMAGESIRSADELRAIVDEAEGAGVIPAAQEELIYNVFDLVNKEAADVLVPAAEVVWVDADSSPRDALAAFAERGHRRLLVGEGSLDRLTGVLHAPDVIRAVQADDLGAVAPLARPAFVVPETKELGALLREFRERREQLAVVVGEYGTTLGIVTLEDILEEIVGEIDSEYELPRADVRWVGDREVEVAGSMSVDDFNEQLGTGLPQTGARTIAGLVFDVLGRGPAEGDRVEVKGVRFRVCGLDGARITRLRAELPRSDA